MPSNNSEAWKEIAERLIKETDSQKVIELAERLNAALEPAIKPVVTTDNPETEVA